MSLQTRLAALAQAVGADIKELRSRSYDLHNSLAVVQGPFSPEAYLLGSTLDLPQGKIKVGTKYRCRFAVTKTAAGTGAPNVKIRIGTSGTNNDPNRLQLTFPSQTAAADEGEFDVEAVFRQAGTNAILQAVARLSHRLATTGLSNAGANSIQIGTSSGVDLTLPDLKIGLAVGEGGTGNWTISLVSAELVNLAP